jgi:hypothetical protein
MRLLDTYHHLKNQHHSIGSERTRYIAHWVKNAMLDNLRSGMKWNRNEYILNRVNIATIKLTRKSFALTFAEAIKNEDADQAMHLINNEKLANYQIMRDPCGVMNDKFSGQFYSCEDCSSVVEDNDLYSVNEGNRSVCSHCRENNYFYSEYYDCYIDDDYRDENGDGDSDDDDRNYDNIGSYHSSSHNLGRIPSKYDDRKPRVLLGLELEMEIKSGYDLDSRAGELLKNIGHYKNHLYALCEEDGSLDNGFEMVTAYTGLDVHKEQLQFFKEQFDGALSHKTSTCGLHIHVCKSDMSTLHACKMVLFINDADNQKLIYALARRDSSSYSKIHDKKNDKHWIKDAMSASKNASDNRLQKKYQIRNLNSDRYEALNFKNEKTIEFRLFKGTLKYQTIMACLEFSFATWHFCKDASQSELTTAKFLEFISKPENRSDTRFLRTYLKEKGFTLAEKDKPAKPATIKQLASTI